MSKPMNKTVKRLLLFLVIVALLGGCFGAVALYAKKEMSKPRFQMPEIDELPSVTALPTDKAALAAYLNRLYSEAVASDETEGSWRTDVDLGGDLDLPFAEDDNAIVSLIRDGAAGEFASLYPAASGVKLRETKDAPVLELDAASITDFTAVQGKVNEEGEPYDLDYYYVDLTLDPAAANAAAITSGDLYAGALDKLKAAVTSADSAAEAQAYTMHFKIDRIKDHLLNAEISKSFRITADVAFTEAYAALANGAAKSKVVFPYKTVQHVDFTWYGARFTERAIVAKAGDMTALPASVVVNGDSTGDDYTLTFTSTDPDAISIDADGVMTVHKAPEETATITMTLKYGAHTYTDTLTVYITELEVETNVG